MEAFFFHADGANDVLFLLEQQRILIGHGCLYVGEHLIKEGLGHAQYDAEAGSAPQDTAQHVAAAFVGRHDAVSDHKGAGTGMVSDNPEGETAMIAVILFAGQLLYPADQTAHNIGIVIGIYLLQDGSHTLQPHAGIDRRTGKRGKSAVFAAFELHKDQIPDLHPAVTIAFADTADRRVTGILFAAVKEDL